MKGVQNIDIPNKDERVYNSDAGISLHLEKSQRILTITLGGTATREIAQDEIIYAVQDVDFFQGLTIASFYVGVSFDNTYNPTRGDSQIFVFKVDIKFGVFGVSPLTAIPENTTVCGQAIILI